MSPKCLEFSPGIVKAFLHSRPGYIPKVPTNVVRPVVLQAFCPPHSETQTRNRRISSAPYGHWTPLSTERPCGVGQISYLSACPPKKGAPVSKQRMSKWMVEAISLPYELPRLPSPLAVCAHSTKAMAASKAFISGVSLSDICDAAGWSSPHTFVRFYNLDLHSTPATQQ